MKIVLFDFKTAKEEWFDLVTEVYKKKLNPFMPIEIIHLNLKKSHKDNSKSSRDESEQRKKAEAQILLEKINDDDFLILFDEKGTELDSIQFAKKIELALGSSKKRLVLVIGGAYGVSDEIKQKAQLKIKLSSLVMNHLVAETVALEQLYRSFTLIKNIPYHNI